MKLSDLLQISGLETNADVDESTFEIQQITSDSRKVKPGTLFVAIQGHKTDGRQYIPQAISHGAVAIVQEKSSQISTCAVPVFRVDSTRAFLDSSLNLFYKEPSLEILCFGVTGTNGKTTSTYLLEYLLNGCGFPTAVMGTIDHHLGTICFPTENTTPGPEELHPRLREFVQHGAKALAMEVTSHALDQKRTDSISFDGVLFTNLTRDHLDYHVDMESYFWSKQKLFDEVLWTSKKPDRVSIVNSDDIYGARIRTAPGTRLVTFGQQSGDYRFQVRKLTLSGMEYSVQYKNQVTIGHTPMVGIHNLYNITGVLALLAEKGFSLRDCVELLSNFHGVPGRLQRIPNSRDRNVFVDYAHTDDALKNVLTSLNLIREQVEMPGRLITVFGCGGDRDKGKRPLMAATAERFSDQVIVTSDNPRTEDPEQIIDDVCEGFQDLKKIKKLTDRRDAIRYAIELSQPGDIVLIAGKGHEDYQIIGTKKTAFRDDHTAAEFLK